jgi:hypothetical protein
MSHLHPHTLNLVDHLDAAVFSGDEFLNPFARAELREALARLERGLAEHDKSERTDLIHSLAFLLQDWERVHGRIPDDHEARAILRRVGEIE